MLAACEDSAPEFEEFPVPFANGLEPGGSVAAEPGVPLSVATVTKGAEIDVSVEGTGSGETDVVVEDEFAPPAAADSWAKPTDGGLERNTV